MPPNGPELSCGDVPPDQRSPYVREKLFCLLKLSLSRGEKLTAISVSLSDWLGGFGGNLIDGKQTVDGNIFVNFLPMYSNSLSDESPIFPLFRVSIP